jgi:hypothetical protein
MEMESQLRELEESHFRVAIFGSARIKKTDTEYQRVYNLARLIASAKMDLVTGGGPGLMEAASEGFRDGKKDPSIYSIGLNIRLPREQRFSAHLDIKKEFDRFSDRLQNFVTLSSAFVVTPGGIGTILGFFYTWQLAQVRHMSNKPIVLMGEMWFDLVQWARDWPLKKGLLDETDMDLIYLARDCDEAFSILCDCHRHTVEGRGDFCRVYRRFK